MGVVYEVDDTARQEIVALKTLRRTTAVDIYRLKREFRSLADVGIRNLVSLYELFADDDQCFFTMEHVPGLRTSSITSAARAIAGPSNERAGLGGPATGGGGRWPSIAWANSTVISSRPTCSSRLRVGSSSSTSVSLTELAPRNAYDDASRGIGTPAYMPPEAAPDVGPTEAVDWYAVGVTLFEALTGTVPFAGTSLDTLARRGSATHRRSPTPPRTCRVISAPSAWACCIAIPCGDSPVGRCFGNLIATRRRRPRSTRSGPVTVRLSVVHGSWRRCSGRFTR